MTTLDTESTPLEAGTVVEGKYKLIEPLGGGGMGQVWSAEHVTLGSLVALKVLHGSIMTSPDHRARFEREARLMAQLGDASRHITKVLEHGVLGDGTPYLVMERLRGEDLATRLKRDRALPLAEAADLIGQLCKALAAAHAEGVVHRDIKPANVFLAKDEDGLTFVKLLDFGVAKALSEAGEQTLSGQVIGTPSYMAPEQLTGEAPVDQRADLFAVGSIIYRCLVGKTAFGRGSLSEMAMRIVSMTPSLPTKENPALPAGTDAFLMKALAKKPDERFQTARELADELARLAGAAGSAAFVRPQLPPGHDSGVYTLASGAGQGTSSSPRPSTPTRRPGWVPLVAVVVVAGGVVAFLLLRRAPAATTAPATVSVASTATAPSSEGAPTASSVAPVAEAPPTASQSSPPAASAAPKGPQRPPAGAARREPGRAPDAPGPVQDTWRKKDEM